jgi:cysteine desulfurase
MRRVYLDHSATTPLDPRVREAMLPALGEEFGNPSSLHETGRRARRAVDRAREQTAALLGCDPGEIVFTGSGTEANNLALLGVFGAGARYSGHVIASAIEHPSVLEACRHLERFGVAVTYLRPDHEGVIHPDALAAALRADTRLVSIMTANNVVGSIQPVMQLGQIARDGGALFHTDAVQAVGKTPFRLADQPIDLLSLGAHKFHGPKGAGALFVRQGIELQPIVFGGGQERGLRSATENVAGVVGLGRAAELAAEEGPADCARLAQWRDRIIDHVLKAIPGAYLLGPRFQRLPGHVCLGFAGLEADTIRLLLALDQEGLDVSTGSACSASHADRPSYILQAMGLDAVRARGSLRITLGRFNTESEVDCLLETLPRVIATLRPAAGFPAADRASSNKPSETEYR